MPRAPPSQGAVPRGPGRARKPGSPGADLVPAWVSVWVVARAWLLLRASVGASPGTTVAGDGQPRRPPERRGIETRRLCQLPWSRRGKWAGAKDHPSSGSALFWPCLGQRRRARDLSGSIGVHSSPRVTRPQKQNPTTGGVTATGEADSHRRRGQPHEEEWRDIPPRGARVVLTRNARSCRQRAGAL